jgi:hypothetical protein
LAKYSCWWLPPFVWVIQVSNFGRFPSTCWNYPCIRIYHGCIQLLFTQVCHNGLHWSQSCDRQPWFEHLNTLNTLFTFITYPTRLTRTHPQTIPLSVLVLHVWLVGKLRYEKLSTSIMTLFGHKASTTFVVSFNDLQSSTCGCKVGEFGAQEYILTYVW